jgi:signal transduction histidine kinase
VQQPRPTPGGAVDRGLTLALLGAVGMAAGVRSLAPLQTLEVRRRVRRFATSLSSASDMAAIAAHLRDTTGDRTIDIELGDRTSDERSAVTTVMRNGRVVATIYHAAAARGRVAAALTPATALALETQLLLRQASEQLSDLKVSRATAVLTADDARRRLERDLHDGAQQRLLVVGMRLAHAAGEGSPGGTLNVAASQVAAALIDLRRIGRGDAAIIAELGLNDAVTAVAGTSPVPMLVAFTPCDDSNHECWPQEVATTAYRVVLGALAAAQSSAAKELAVEMRCLGGGNGRLVATRHDGQRTADRGADHDRVFASGGRIVRDDGRGFEAWLP